MSLKNQAEKFDALKKANSPWFSLESGESAKVTLRTMQAGTRTDEKTGVVSAVMTFDFDVETEEGLKIKKWNTSSSKLIQTFIDAGIDIGSTFVITKRGEGFGTTYEVADVVNKGKPPVATGTANASSEAKA